MPNYRQDIVLSYGALLDEIGRFVDYAGPHLQPAQRRAFESTATKLVGALESHMRQAGYLIDQYERMSGRSSVTTAPPGRPSSRPPAGRVVVPFRRRS